MSSRATVIGLVVGVHHLIAIYSISAEKFSLPLANFSSTVLFSTALIVNALPLAFAGGLGAISHSLFKSDLFTQIVFLTTFIIGSTAQWALVGSIILFLLNWFRGAE